MADKQVVEFGRVVGWTDDPYRGVLTATLADVKGYPKLGDEQIVYTSRVERIEYGDDGSPTEIETRNTIYRRRA